MSLQQKENINIGLDKADEKEIAEGLVVLLANSYSLYLRTQNYHWNLTGSMFFSLHNLFEEQYTDLASAIDSIAERIRALGYKAPATFKEFIDVRTVTETDDGENQMAKVANLLKGHEELISAARKTCAVAEKANDQASADLITGRLAKHEMEAWKLRSIAAE
jgi:starvation-inducible DNA-binding protein